MKVYYFLFLLLLSVSSFAAGVADTRVIYNESKKQFAQDIFSEDSKDMLIKVWISDKLEKTVPGIVVVPNIFIMSGKSKRLVKILNLNSQLTPDRESLLYLNVMSLPPEEDRSGMSVITPIIARYKLFLRPNSMKHLKLEDAVAALKWSIKDGSLEVINPSPFHIVAAKLQINGQSVDIDLIHPKSTKIIEGKFTKNTDVLKFSYINDQGGNTSPVATPVN